MTYNGTLTSTTTLGQRLLGNCCNESVLHIPHWFSVISRILIGIGVLILLQRCCLTISDHIILFFHISSYILLDLIMSFMIARIFLLCRDYLSFLLILEICLISTDLQHLYWVIWKDFSLFFPLSIFLYTSVFFLCIDFVCKKMELIFKSWYLPSKSNNLTKLKSVWVGWEDLHFYLLQNSLLHCWCIIFPILEKFQRVPVSWCLYLLTWLTWLMPSSIFFLLCINLHSFSLLQFLFPSNLFSFCFLPSILSLFLSVYLSDFKGFPLTNTLNATDWIQVKIPVNITR